MSQEAVEALRSAYEQFARGEFGVVDNLRDDVEVEPAPEMPDAGTYRGHAARSWVSSWVESFESLTLEAVEFTIRDDLSTSRLELFMARG
ncbi:MAG: hypothetical protein ACXWG2_12780, partial [Solirubrobacterales bacterium]